MKVVLHFAPHQLDWIKVRRIRRQEPHFGTSSLDEFKGLLVLVGTEIVHDYDVSRAQSRQQHLTHVSTKNFPIGGPIGCQVAIRDGQFLR